MSLGGIRDILGGKKAKVRKVRRYMVKMGIVIDGILADRLYRFSGGDKNIVMLIVYKAVVDALLDIMLKKRKLTKG